MKQEIKVLGMWKILCCMSGVLGSYQGISTSSQKAAYSHKVEEWLNDVDSDLSEFNSLAAHFTWKLSTTPDEKTSENALQLGKARNRWKNKVCESDIEGEMLTDDQRRKIYLLCRGPKFDDMMAIEYLQVLGRLAEEYNSEVCLTGSYKTTNKSKNFPNVGDCLYGEPDLERLMKRTDLEPDALKWIWLNWHNSVGPRLKELFRLAANYQNEAARNNGYNDVGEVWREELETPELENFVVDLYKEVEPLYQMLHAVVRHKLFLKYGSSQVDPKGPIPIHLLGNMWGQDWSPLLELFSISQTNINLNQKLKHKKPTIKDLVLEAEDFYTSLGLPPMTDKFWKFSIFEETQNTTLCHGTAANLYTKDDFRMLMCGEINMNDFYVIHHEMGHIEYYMAYQDQPAVFQDGTTSAFHESIGDAIMHAVMTPQHLHRLNLITDNQLLDNNTGLFLLFHQALTKIPEIPFSLILDKYRWDVFKGAVSYNQWNEYFWNLNLKYRGIVPPEERNSEYFDAGAKFHVPDNTPYIRYFLSSIIQMQIFQSMCEVTLYGGTVDGQNGDDVALHTCDIYGAKNAGKRLLAMMKTGASVQWPEALFMLSGTSQISAKPFLDYYKPVYEWLKTYIEKNNVYVGW